MYFDEDYANGRIEELSYLSVVVCFVAFLVNDIYGFINWNKMYKRQNGCNEI